MAADGNADALSGFITALYLFDVAEGINAAALTSALGSHAAPARFEDKTAGPSRVIYAQVPVVVEGVSLGVPEVAGFRVRVKFFDYGVVSLMLTRTFTGGWPDLIVAGQLLIENEPLEERATTACREIVSRVKSALMGARDTYLSEDYLVFAVTSRQQAGDAEDLILEHGDDVAQLLRGERLPLSLEERRTVLRHRLSYLADDLVVPAWNAAFIFDNEGGAMATVDLLEFANSQLLELRYHDETLEAQLGRLYGELERPRHGFAGRRHMRAALEVQAILIEVNELTDRIENAVKFVGDPYSARLLGIVGDRLGLSKWKHSVDEKLRTLDDIRRFTVEQARLAQANVLELAIVLILVLELGLFFAGIMQ